jgi:hypothetical protein
MLDESLLLGVWYVGILSVSALVLMSILLSEVLLLVVG